MPCLRKGIRGFFESHAILIPVTEKLKILDIDVCPSKRGPSMKIGGYINNCVRGRARREPVIWKQSVTKITEMEAGKTWKKNEQ